VGLALLGGLEDGRLGRLDLLEFLEDLLVEPVGLLRG
jgi:hypothetical protein